MNRFKEYDEVRVVKLLHETRSFFAELGERPPRVGDIGAIVNIAEQADGSVIYTVENVDPNGMTIWLDNFSSTELEPV
jgi:hypothetical protein